MNRRKLIGWKACSLSHSVLFNSQDHHARGWTQAFLRVQRETQPGDHQECDMKVGCTDGTAYVKILHRRRVKRTHFTAEPDLIS